MENDNSSTIDPITIDESPVVQAAIEQLITDNKNAQSIQFVRANMPAAIESTDDICTEMKKKRAQKTHDFKNTDGPVWDAIRKRWLVRLAWYETDSDGIRRRREVKREFRRKREADKFYEETQRQIILGTYAHQVRVKKLTFGYGADRYRDSVRKNKSFLPTVDQRLRIWERTFGRETRLGDITRSRIVDAITKMLEGTPQGLLRPKRGVKKSTADGYLNVLKSMFKYLRREEIYTIDPTERIAYFKVDNRRTMWLLPDQFLHVVAACDPEPWYVKPIVVVAGLTGLRRANVLCLEWAEVDFDAGYIEIAGEKMKSGRTIQIEMCHFVYETLYGLWQTRNERTPSRYVFVDDEMALNGRRAHFSRELKMEGVRRVEAGEKPSRVARDLRITHDQLCHWMNRDRRYDGELGDTRRRTLSAGPVPEFVFENAWRRALERSGVAEHFRVARQDSFHFHDLRHTFATWCAMIGTDPYDLQRRLSHSDQKMTQRYIDLSKSEPRNASTDQAGPDFRH